METNELEIESESFAHDIEELIEKENLADMMDLQDIVESDINDLNTESDSLQDTCYESSWQGVINSNDLKQDKTWDNRECNGSLIPCHLLNPREVESMLEAHSDNAVLKPALTDDSHYSDISSCSETEANLVCKLGSSVEVNNDGDQPGQSSEDGEQHSSNMPFSNKDVCSGPEERNIEETNINKTNQQQDIVEIATPVAIGESKGENKGTKWRDGLLSPNVEDQFSEAECMGNLNGVEGHSEKSDVYVHNSRCSVDPPMMNCDDLGSSQEGTLNNPSSDASSISNGDENKCSTTDSKHASHLDQKKVDLENTFLKPDFKETVEISTSCEDSLGGCKLEEAKTEPENASSKPEETFDMSGYEKLDGQKGFTSNDGQVVERSSFGFLESCFGLKSTEQNVEECLKHAQVSQSVETGISAVENVTQIPQDNLFNHTEPPVLLKAVFESNSDQMDRETDVPKDPPVLSPYKTTKTSFKSQKRKLQPVVLLKTTERQACDNQNYHCFACQESTQTLDELIEHCHHVHSLHKVQYCTNCECYFSGDTIAGHCCEQFKQMDHSSPVYAKGLMKEKMRFICRYCGKPFFRQVYYEEHEQRHTVVTQHRCECCGIYFPSLQKCHSHKRKKNCLPLILEPSVHTKDHYESAVKKPKTTDLRFDTGHSNMKLPDCYVKLVDVCKEKQSPRKIDCHICGKSFRLRAQLKSHLISHSEVKPFKCENCEKDFKYSWNLTKHKKEACPQSVSVVPSKTSSNTDSNLLAKFKCPICFHLFKHFYNRARHLREHCLKEYMRKGKGKIGDKYWCPLCKEKFTMSCNRNRHIKNTCIKLKQYTAKGKMKEKAEKEITSNNKDKDLLSTQPMQNGARYKCSFCPATYSSKSGFYTHLAKHKLLANNKKMINYNKAVDLKSPSTESANNENAPITCRFCGRVFTSRLILNKHIKIHEGNRPFRCLDCGKNFARHAHLVTHKNVHKRKLQCSVCWEVLPSIGDLLKHRQSHPEKGTLKCPECPMQFKFPVFLLRHVVVHERKQKFTTPPQAQHTTEKVDKMYKEEFRCAVCQESFVDSKALSEHCLTHMPERCESKCQFCKRHFSNRTGLVRHIRLHTGEKPFPCGKCGKHFRRQEAVRVHQDKCTGVPFSQKSNAKQVQGKDTASDKANNPYKCSYCPQSFRFSSNLKGHEKAHLAQTVFPCQKCGKYYRKRKLKEHTSFCQGKEFPSCRKCGRTFIRENYKNSHEKHCRGNASKETKMKVKIKQQCPQCFKLFRYRIYLLRHLSSHSRDKPFACMHCGEKYKSQQRCLQHEAFCDAVSKEHKLESSSGTENTKSKIAEVRNEEELKVVPRENRGELKCKFCTKSFSRPRYLRRHILTHTEVKPYRCKTCDGCFSRYDHLKLHQNRCKGKRRLEVRVVKMSVDRMDTRCQKDIQQENELQCKICSKQLSTSSDLKRHISMSHVTDKPYSCKRCGQKYTSQKSLRRHNVMVKCKKVSKKSVQPPKKYVQDQPCRETSKLLQRIQVHYMNKFKYQCKYCPRRFKQLGQLTVHTRLHTGEKPYGCAECGEHFIRRDYLKRHLVKCSRKAESQEKVLCDRCGDLFTHKVLLVHQKTCVVSSKSSGSSEKAKKDSQTKIKGFSCAYCSDRFLLFSQLQQHLLTKHRSNPQQLELSPMQIVKHEIVDEGHGQSQPSSSQLPATNQPENSNKDLDKPLKCSHCHMRFANKAGLGMHMRIHTGVYPLSCKRCNVGFWSKKTMEKHRKRCSFYKTVNKQNEPTMESTEELESTLTDTVLVFNKGSNTTGTGVLQTKFSCKDHENDSEKSDMAIHKYQCSECDQSFTDGLRLISHLEEHGREDQERRSGDVHRCHICSKVFGQAGVLQRHVKTHHENKKTISCPTCSKTFRCPADLDLHRVFHDPSRPFVCNICSLRFWTTKAMAIHQKLVHSAKEPPNLKDISVKAQPELYECKPCGKVYTVKKSYVKHCKVKHKEDSVKTLPENDSSGNQESDNEQSNRNFEDDDSDNDSDSAPYFPCHVCGKTFLTSENLEDHQRCHLGEKPFECEECGKCFFQLVNLQQHQRSHKSEFQCQMCGKGFVSLFALRKHKQSHVRNTPHRCTKCHLSFTRSAELAEHMVTHRDENFPCDLCDETFSCKTSRAEHRKKHTEQEEDLPPLIPPSKPQAMQMPSPVSSRSLSSNVEQYKYRCGICQVRFPDPEQLSEHGCNPGKDRPYSCPECNKHFLHGSHLKKHQLSHQLSARRSYQCKRCSMSFSHHHHYLTHIRSHGDKEASEDMTVPGKEKVIQSGFAKLDKIYQCPICPESFYQAMDLANHLSVHSHLCTVCNTTFPTKEDLEEHETCHLTAATQYECTECGDSFLGSDAFRKHQCRNRKLPFSNKPTSSFSSPLKKKRSERLYEAVNDEEEEVDVGVDFIKCTICQKRFSSSSSLTEHQRTEHEERPFKCLVCRKGFTKKRYLTQHQQIHSERPYRCNVCPESFKTETALLSHNKTHDAKRQHHCSACSKSYLTASELYKHQRKHGHEPLNKDSEEYQCDMCYKSFNLFSQLTKHQETHVGQVVYECTECDKAFAYPGLLEEHQRSHAVSTESLQPQPPTHFPFQSPVNE